jgi:protein-L-isoaspartate(D-aspartate) O-methyltransferase
MTDSANSTKPAAGAASTWAAQRTNMVDSQVRPSDISDSRIIAYMDNPVPLTRKAVGRVLMEPRLFAKLLQLAEIPDGGRVLEIGCGTGYGLAVLTAMGLTATGLEEDSDLVAAAQGALKQAAGAHAPVVKSGPLMAGVADAGPFDAILMSGSVAEVPPALLDQLKSGGRLVAVLGTGPGGKATVWVRSGTSFGTRDAFDAGAAPLPGFRKAAGFVF